LGFGGCSMRGLEGARPVAGAQRMGHLDAQLAELLREPGPVAVSDLARQQLGARRDDARAHAHAHAFPANALASVAPIRVSSICRRAAIAAHCG